MLKKIKILTLLCLLIFSFEHSFAQKKKKTINKKTAKVGTIVGETDVAGGNIDNSIPEKATQAQKRRYETFDKVWSTINDYYFDPTFNGLNWNVIRTEFRSRIINLKSDFELHQIIQEMINRFNRSHFYVILPEAFEEIENAKIEIKRKEAERKKADSLMDNVADSPENQQENLDQNEIFYKYGVLIDLRIIGNEVVITDLVKDSNAAKAGLRQGYILEKINGVSLKDLMYRIENYKYSANSLKKQMPKILLSFLEGEADSEVELSFLNETNQPMTTIVKREGIKGELVSILKNLPEQLVVFEKKSLNEKTGYIKFNLFAFPVLNKFCEALTEFKNKESLVIDLRGNMGGAISVLWGLSGLLTNKTIILGTEIKRNGRDPHVIRPMPKNYKGGIVILVDGQSVSAAEIFASGLQENKRATIIGERTAGEALPALSVALPTGGSFIYPFASFQSPKGVILEGKGVEPTFSIPLERRSLLEGRDIQLEKAINFLDVEKTKSAALIVGDSDEPPPAVKTPTPKPISKPNPPVAGNAVSPSPIKPLTTSVISNQDEKALQIVGDFINAIGGEAALRNISSYTAIGTVELNRNGSIVTGGFELSRKAPNKVAESLTFDSSGEVREIYDGQNYFVQSLFTGIIKQEFLNKEYGLFADFYELVKFKETYPNLKYTGQYIRLGRKTEVIEATTTDGLKVSFGFDANSKLLVSRTGIYLHFTFDDYQKFGNLLIPTLQTRQNTFTIKIKEINFEVQIPDSKFMKEDNCFTKID